MNANAAKFLSQVLPIHAAKYGTETVRTRTDGLEVSAAEAKAEERFNTVKNPENWKLAIDVTVAKADPEAGTREAAAEEAALMVEAVTFYVGAATAKVVPSTDRTGWAVHVTSPGYYATIGA